MALHLVVDITGHGFGHAAQVAPVIDALSVLVPDLRLTLRTALPAPLIRSLFGTAVAIAAPAPDLGLVMTGPIDVDVDASANAYRALHADWPGVVRHEAERLAALDADLLLSNVAYTSLAGAAAAGIPAVALSSLNWADIYHRYCGNRPEAPRIHGEMLAAYASARWFVQLTPHPPMTDLPNRRSVGPVAPDNRRDTRSGLAARLNLEPGERLALFTLGGIAARDEVRTLPRLPGLRWLVAPGLDLVRNDVVPTSTLGLSFSDLIRASDVVVTKPGYGTMVEAICAGSRLIYCERPDWPETPYLDHWARSHGAARMIGRADFAMGRYEADLAALLAQSVPTPPPADGAPLAATILRATAGLSVE